MTKVTPQEIEIIKRIATIQGIRHVVEKRYNGETDQEEDCDCFYSSHGRDGFEWCSAYETFEDFIKEYARFHYDKGYNEASRCQRDASRW